ncbi:hypothetical protein GBA52_001004, partial [Prunus armeniaca]
KIHRSLSLLHQAPSMIAAAIPEPSSRILRGQRRQSKAVRLGPSVPVLGFDDGGRGE